MAVVREFPKSNKLAPEIVTYDVDKGVEGDLKETNALLTEEEPKLAKVLKTRNGKWGAQVRFPCRDLAKYVRQKQNSNSVICEPSEHIPSASQEFFVIDIIAVSRGSSVSP